MSVMKGLLVQIYRSDCDCTNGGITSPAAADGKAFVVFDEAFDGNWDLDSCKDTERFVCLKIVRRRFGAVTYMHLEPMFSDRGHAMAGGNFAFTWDSRFRRVAEYPLPVHDRYEA